LLGISACSCRSNRNLVTDNDLVWLGSKYHKLSTSSGYAILSVNNVSVNGKLGVEKLQSCEARVFNQDWYNMPEDARDPMKPTRSYGIAPWDKEMGQIFFGIDVTNVTKKDFTFITGTLIPKDKFNSSKPFNVSFYGFGNWNGDVTTVYSGTTVKK
jgi:hypothetical protein